MAAVKKSGVVDAQRQERVKARWSLLRQALLGSSSDGGDANNNDDRFHEHSTNSFLGFHVLDRTILPRECEDNHYNNTLIECDENWNIVKNSYTSKEGHRVQFFTREAKEQQRPNNQQSTIQSRAEALLSHRKYGVDNTGNVRVWDAETTLAGFCLSVVFDGDDDACEIEGNEQAIKLSNLRKNLRSLITNDDPGKNAGGENNKCHLLELGSGQAGLAGLAMVAASTYLEGRTVSNNNKRTKKSLHVVLTDGHPKCVDNNEICVKMTSKRNHAARVQLEARLLLWDSSSKGVKACRQINKLIRDTAIIQSDNDASSESDRRELCTTKTTADEGLYQILFASDCVHFQEFHDGLLTTIARTLAINGIALLCQPRREKSLQNFMILVDAVNASRGDNSIHDGNHSPIATNHGEVVANGSLFQMILFEDFNAKVSAMHTALLSEATNGDENFSYTTKNPSNTKPLCSSQYDPNRHRPLLLMLRKLRPYDEEIDGYLARHHVNTRV